MVVSSTGHAYDDPGCGRLQDDTTHRRVTEWLREHIQGSFQMSRVRMRKAQSSATAAISEHLSGHAACLGPMTLVSICCYMYERSKLWLARVHYRCVHGRPDGAGPSLVVDGETRGRLHVAQSTSTGNPQAR
jgi:hypothetical protein